MNWLRKLALKLGILEQIPATQPESEESMRKIRVQSVDQAVTLAKQAPVKVAITSKRKRGKAKAEKRFVYQDKSGQLRQSSNGAAAKPVTSSPADLGQSRAERTRQSFRPLGVRSLRISPKMPRLR